MDSEAPVPKLLLSEEEDKQENEESEDDNKRTPCKSITVLNRAGTINRLIDNQNRF